MAITSKHESPQRTLEVIRRIPAEREGVEGLTLLIDQLLMAVAANSARCGGRAVSVLRSGPGVWYEACPLIFLFFAMGGRTGMQEMMRMTESFLEQLY